MTEPITINGRAMRIMWGSNSPLVAGGYGVTTSLIVPRLRDRLGIDIAVSATYGHYGRKIVWNGIDIYPPGYAMFGNDIHAANAKQHHADILLTHQDVWTQMPDQLTARGTRWVSWQPLDSEPVAPTIVERLQHACYQPIALARFGQQQAELAGMPMPLVLQGVDTNIFRPGDQAVARKALGWPESAYIVGMVARNSGYPNRKAFPQQFEAFAQFAQAHPDSLLYVHAVGDPGGGDPEATPIAWQLEAAGLSGRVIWAHPYDLNMGYKTEDLVTRYVALDVLLQVSMSEGCGVPLLEAQACGVPVITGAWTAMEENCYAGWLVARDESEQWPVSPLHCYWRLPHIDAIRDRLEEAYGTLASHGAREYMARHARQSIVAYHDQDMLIDTQWRAVLSDIARRIEAEPYPWHVHKWSGWGYQTSSGVVQACTVDWCYAEKRGDDIADLGFPLTVGGIPLDIEDDPIGGVKYAIATEVEQIYHLPDLSFEPGDIIFDIGAHVGIVSCYLAKLWPDVKVYAFEPIPANYARLVQNIAANGITNITALNLAVTADGRALSLSGDPSLNTGGYSAFSERGPLTETVPSQSLLDFLDQHHIDRIALLKLDCEGAEYEILHSMNGRLLDVDRLIMEVHENSATRAEFGSGARLIAKTEEQIPIVNATLIRIPDPPIAIEHSQPTFVAEGA